ncbi:MAG: UDP-N-acetylmuramoyl-L-alanyl-D-glutamate--2,6-diaminopimelate ligase [Propionibacteriaceae bacterium]|jgi:UDP-N-acetylmuramoyl-L-alanyl-D-glutamate--2,6-diaminopimelate ligase|nr:UDP-N-acetylmuramoyl-L-alanyl-D-glutamate--2,6-diaminopimelate ligase [Propionibacteriaceae bacterium]
MKLGALLAGLEYQVMAGPPDPVVSALAYDSRKATPGGVFVALPSARGPHFDGTHFLSDAYARGARVFVVDESVDLAAVAPDHTADDTITLVTVPDTRQALALMSARWFDFPAKRLTVIGITGTKGKTTVSYMLRSILERAGRRVGLIGSNGVLYNDVHIKLPNTTPESYDLHRIMADMVEAGVDILVMEATSQGFGMRRTHELRFDIGVYTNISRDHISDTEHASFEEYLACKHMIFSQTDFCVVNHDTPLFKQIVAGANCQIRTYGMTPASDVWADDIELGNQVGEVASSFTCHLSPTIRGGACAHFTLEVPGGFNISNALAALAVAERLGIARQPMQEGLAHTLIPGRMEVVPTPEPYTIVIDFAHNHLSMESLVKAVREHHPQRILTVFGLEGNRSRDRRFDCGEVLGREFDHIILADASPRTDDPDQIIADIATGIERFGGGDKYEIIRDRHQAIPAILDQARPGDLILLIGKGDVPYEEVNGVNHPLDEREIVRQYFDRHGR